MGETQGVRILREHQVSMFRQYSDHRISGEMENISAWLDRVPQALEWVLEDLAVGKDTRGAKGMSAEEVLRAGVLKQQNEWTYRELEFNLVDSAAARAFVRVRNDRGYSDSCLQNAIKKISESTWEKLNREILKLASSEGIEKGRVVRMDSTVVETNISYPRDSSMLVDCLRVVSRVCSRLLLSFPVAKMKFTHKKGRKLMLEILDAKNDEERRPVYEKLIVGTGDVWNQLPSIISAVEEGEMNHKKKKKIVDELTHVLLHIGPIIAQSIARVIDGKKVKSEDKVVSLFEPHTDVIVKGKREVEFGHKVFFTTGKSNLVLDCKIESGNPSDTSLFIPLVKAQKEIYGRAPRQTSTDGGFASAENVKLGKENGVTDICFSKRCGLEILDMVKSSFVFKKLRNFRAGVESNISCLKRAFGLTRANWKGFVGFKSYVWSSVVSYNLSILGSL